MTSKEFFKKFKSKYLWGNITAMIVVVILLCVGLKFGIDLYTHHGEEIVVPSIKYKNFNDAEQILDDAGLKIEVSDTGYVKSLPPGCILEQSPEPGQMVKSGHIIYVTINSPHTPTLTIPDLIDNSSYREAKVKLISMGFKLAEPQYVAGEKDWVYGITCKGRQLSAGDRVGVDDFIVIQVGDGRRSAEDSVDYTDPNYEQYEGNEPSATQESGDVDEFEEVPATEEPSNAEKTK